MTLVPGVYCFTSSAALTGTLTLDGQGNAGAVWIFQIGSTLVTAASTPVSKVELTNGAQACNVFWQVGSSATIQTGTQFVGSIVALTSITLVTGATVAGRALARNGAVAMDTNTTTAAGCSTTVAPTVVKTFDPTDIMVGANSTLTITLLNSNSTPVTNVTLVDTMPGQITIVGTPTTTCGGTFNPTTLSLTGVTIPANGSCTVTATVTSIDVGTHTNNVNLTSDQGGASGNADLIVRAGLKVHILKYLDGVKATLVSAGGYQFPMTATWSAPNIGAGTGTYVLGTNFGGAPDLYGADTSAMTPLADYTTSEITGAGPTDVLAIGDACVPGRFQLVGYSFSTSSFANAATQATTNAAPVFTGISTDRWVIVRNRKCPTTGTLVVNKTTTGGTGTFQFTSPGLVPASFSIDNSGTVTFFDVPPGPYTITETPQAGWTQTPGSCSVTVAVGVVSTCNFFNTKIVPPHPGKLELKKKADRTTYKSGDVITYTYTLKNTGGVTLQGPFYVTDDKIGTPPGTPFLCGTLTTTLAPGAYFSCTSTYTVKDTDLCNVTTSFPQGVTANIDTGQWLGFVNSTQDTKITGAPGLPNGTYPCWCIQDHVPGDLHNKPAKLYSTIGSGLPSDVANLAWKKVNYTLNNKLRKPGISTLGFLQDVQTAIWVLTGELKPEWGVSTWAKKMIDAANMYGGNYVPGPDGIAAVIIYSDGMGKYDWRDGKIQESICEVKPPKCNKTIVNKATASGGGVTSNEASATVSAK
jgi:uncharacterized repeat protein (TIGR01451 family)